MNRRSFLSLLGGAAAIAVAPISGGGAAIAEVLGLPVRISWSGLEPLTKYSFSCWLKFPKTEWLEYGETHMTDETGTIKILPGGDTMLIHMAQLYQPGLAPHNLIINSEEFDGR